MSGSLPGGGADGDAGGLGRQLSPADGGGAAGGGSPPHGDHGESDGPPPDADPPLGGVSLCSVMGIRSPKDGFISRQHG